MGLDAGGSPPPRRTAPAGLLFVGCSTGGVAVEVSL
jgi:hypothetical protein